MINFPICRENRNLEPITIRYDVGHPVNIVQYSDMALCQTKLECENNSFKSFVFGLRNKSKRKGGEGGWLLIPIMTCKSKS